MAVARAALETRRILSPEEEAGGPLKARARRRPGGWPGSLGPL